MDKWKLAEVKGALFSLLLKVDIMAAADSRIPAAQSHLEEALEILEEIRE